MARTVIEDSPIVVEDSSGPALGMIVGLLLGIAVVVLAVLFFSGTWDNNNTPSPTPGNDPGPGASAPANPQDQQPSVAPS